MNSQPATNALLNVSKRHYLLADALRLGNNPTEASRHYAEAHRLLDDIRKEANNDSVLKRNDLATIYPRWSQAPKAKALRTKKRARRLRPGSSSLRKQISY